MLVRASRTGSYKDVKILLSNCDVEVDITDTKDGRSALMAASLQGDSKTVTMLLRKGAGANVRGKLKQETALMLAAFAGQPKVARQLLRARAEVDLQDAHGATALLMAAAKGNLRLLPLLLRASADPTISNKDGHTPLGLLAGKGDERWVRRLIGAKAQLDVASGRGNAPLTRAAGGGHARTAHVRSHTLLATTHAALDGVRLRCAAPARVRRVAELAGRGWQHAADGGGRLRAGRRGDAAAAPRHLTINQNNDVSHQVTCCAILAGADAGLKNERGADAAQVAGTRPMRSLLAILGAC
jgi:hypothetical protein